MIDRILLIDDEPHVLAALYRLLRRELRTPEGRPYRIDIFTDPARALGQASMQTYALAISDYRMPDCNGVDFLSALRFMQPDCSRIILSAHAQPEAVVAAVNDAAIERYVTKPWDDQQLLRILTEVLNAGRQRRETDTLADQQRALRGDISLQEAELRRLERLEPGLTAVNRDSYGRFILEDPPCSTL